MNGVVLFIAVTAAFAFFDARRMAEDGLKREIAAYCAASAAGVFLAVYYFTTRGAISPVEAIGKIVRIF